MHLESIYLDLVTSKYAHEFVLLQQLLDWLLAKVIRTLPLRIVYEIVLLCIFIFLDRVGPHQIAEQALKRYFLKSIDVVDLVDHVQLWRYSAVHGEVLVVDNAGNGQSVKELHE